VTLVRKENIMIRIRRHVGNVMQHVELAKALRKWNAQNAIKTNFVTYKRELVCAKRVTKIVLHR
jgi:hypothetical protein